jgi:putative spermidine/putrescine transport system substrate-binding protein/spermidine/putrescine transport system substrate-binding protein
MFCATAAAFLITAPTPGSAGGEINMLVWEGYADPSFIDPFEAATGCKVSATYVGSNDDYAAKLAAGGGIYDLTSAPMDSTGVLIDAGFLEPIDLSRIKGWDGIYPQFRNAKAINVDGKVYGVPYIWGAVPIMYRTDMIKDEIDSIEVFWDPKYSGKISIWDDKTALYMGARLSGHDNVYTLNDEQLADATNKLIEQKPLLRKYWATAGELIDLFVKGEVWISNTWGGYQSSVILAEGIPVVEVIPKEGAGAYADAWNIVKGVYNRDCAYEYINFAISPEGQCGVYRVTGYSLSNEASAKTCMTPEEFTASHQDDPAYFEKLNVWENLGPKLEPYTNAWNAVKAAR